MERPYVLSKLTFILFSLFYSSFLFGSGIYSKWEVAKEDEGIKILTREVKNSNFLEFQGQVKIKTTMDKVLALVTDIKRCPEWIDTCEQGKLLKKISNTESYTYTYNNAPWPVSDRDAIVHNVLTKSKFSDTVVIKITGVPDFIPVTKDVVRVKRINAWWKFIQKKGGKVEIIYNVHNDPGGILPAWLVNSAAVSQPFNTLLNMKKILEKKQKLD